MDAHQLDPAETLPSAERLKLFTDAVVAIAMTLLILPLLESVGEAATARLSTSEYLHEHAGQLFRFALSFVIIVNFWMLHLRLYAHVERYTQAILWLGAAWMFTIVWLPVATAMVGAMRTDGAQRALYIGTMLATALITAATQAVVLRSPAVWAQHNPPQPGPPGAFLVPSALYAAALVVAVVVPVIGYWALLLLLLGGPVRGWLSRRSG